MRDMFSHSRDVHVHLPGRLGSDHLISRTRIYAKVKSGRVYRMSRRHPKVFSRISDHFSSAELSGQRYPSQMAELQGCLFQAQIVVECVVGDSSWFAAFVIFTSR